MTLRIQPPGLADRVLARMGKKRAVYVGLGGDRYGLYIARRENFLRALFRPRSKPPPAGWVYWDEPHAGGDGEDENAGLI